MSASRRLSRNSSGPSKSRILIFTVPSPCGTWLSEPGAGDDPVLVGEPLRLLVEAAHGDARVEDLEDVDVLHDLQQVLVVGHRVQAVERMRDVGEPALRVDRVDRLLAATCRAGSSPR